MLKYDNTPTVIVTLIPCDGGLVLIRRNEEDGKGKLAIPGGFQERPYSIQETAAKEVKEETGLIIDPWKLNYFDMQTIPNGHLNLLCCSYPDEVEKPEVFVHDNEVQEVIIAREPCETAFELHTRWVDRWFVNRLSGISPNPDWYLKRFNKSWENLG